MTDLVPIVEMPTIDGMQRLYRLDNNYGASLIYHPAGEVRSYGLELAVICWYGEGPMDWRLDERNPVADDVVGWLTPEELPDWLDRIAALPLYEPKPQTWMVPLDFAVATDIAEQAAEAVGKWLNAVVILHHGEEAIRGWMEPGVEPYDGDDDAAGVRWTVSVTLAVDTVTPDEATVMVNERLATTPGLPAHSGAGTSPIVAWVAYGAAQPEEDELDDLIAIDAK